MWALFPPDGSRCSCFIWQVYMRRFDTREKRQNTFCSNASLEKEAIGLRLFLCGKMKEETFLLKRGKHHQSSVLQSNIKTAVKSGRTSWLNWLQEGLTKSNNTSSVYWCLISKTIIRKLLMNKLNQKRNHAIKNLYLRVYWEEWKERSNIFLGRMIKANSRYEDAKRTPLWFVLQ